MREKFGGLGESFCRLSGKAIGKGPKDRRGTKLVGRKATFHSLWRGYLGIKTKDRVREREGGHRRRDGKGRVPCEGTRGKSLNP